MNKSIFYPLHIFTLGLIASMTPLGAAPEKTVPEPTLEQAMQWWAPLTDYWTPVGWKHHRFRYNVFFDGTLFARPELSDTAQEWAGQGVQLRILPLPEKAQKAYDTMRAERYALADDHRSHQGWTENAAPVLWTEWSADGLLLREHVFAYIPGAAPVKTGLEPLFAWVRLSVFDTCPGLPLPKRYSFAIQFNGPNVQASMIVRKNIRMVTGKSTYPRALKADAQSYDPAKGLRILEPDGKVRLAIAAGAQVDATFLPGDSNGNDPLLTLSLDAKAGEHVDLLVPMIPTDRAIVDKELEHGYDPALKAADKFWTGRPATAATVDVPETYINDTIHQFERYAEVLSERVPETGMDVSLSGSLAYVKVWATPTGKMVAMLLDPLGYHDLAGEYLEPFIEAQGTIKPPSSYLEKHPGYLGSPAQFKSIDWIPDHGSLLFAIANHALLMNDVKKKSRYVEPIIKGCEFIQFARRVKGHGGVEGILPPARYSDHTWQAQGVWNDGWTYKGLATAARFLRQINHPRAQEFTAEAEDYKRTFVAAFREAAARTDTWRDAQGNLRPFVPTSLHGFVEEGARIGFYLDTGPMMLVFAGLLPADDPLMQAALEWFRNGPIQRFARYDGTYSQVGFLRHEMSSAIPGYSWNVFINHQSGDRKHFLEGMYSQYAGAITRQTRTVCETRFGITGRITHADTPFYMTRLAAVDDIIVENELHLLRLCPLGWMVRERETKFESMPTEFGPVSLRWRLADDGATLRLDYTPKFHTPPAKVILHVPPLEGLKTISVNGRNYSTKDVSTIEL